MIPKAHHCVMREQNPKWPLRPKGDTRGSAYIALND